MIKKSIKDRILHTKNNRPESWWNSVSSLELWLFEEHQYQEDYAKFIYSSTFDSLRLCTNDMDWKTYEKTIIKYLKNNY